MGKGSNQRPTNKGKFDDGYEKAFGAKKDEHRRTDSKTAKPAGGNKPC
jgi:hypothetical protein